MHEQSVRHGPMALLLQLGQICVRSHFSLLRGRWKMISSFSRLFILFLVCQPELTTSVGFRFVVVFYFALNSIDDVRKKLSACLKEKKKKHRNSVNSLLLVWLLAAKRGKRWLIHLRHIARLGLLSFLPISYRGRELRKPVCFYWTPIKRRRTDVRLIQ